MNDYSDRLKKLSIYKEELAKSFLKNGMFPNSHEIEKRLADINLSLSIFRVSPVISGDQFDAEKFNTDMLNIMRDLTILYEIAYKLSLEDYNEIKSFVETHLTELENLATQYDYRSKHEIIATPLGRTLFTQSSGFDIAVDNDKIEINLGEIKTHNGTKLMCVFDADEIDQTNVFFSFDGEYCSPYVVNHDYKSVGGRINCTKYETPIIEDISITSSFPILIDGFVPSYNNKYVIYGGKNQLIYRTSSQTEFSVITIDRGVKFSEAGSISFYVLGGSYAHFNFGTQPTKKNFTETSVRELDEHHLFQLEFDDSFSFSINTDGNIYATKQNGFVKNEILYYPEIHQVHSFLVEEYDTSETTKYDTKVIIQNYNSRTPLKINLIAIKELEAIT